MKLFIAHTKNIYNHVQAIKEQLLEILHILQMEKQRHILAWLWIKLQKNINNSDKQWLSLLKKNNSLKGNIKPINITETTWKWIYLI
jgi:hypothetical protein